MIAEWGRLAAAFALALSMAGLFMTLRAPQRAGAHALLAQGAALSSIVAFALLTWLFIRSDFSVKLVVDHSHIDKPLGYKITGVWANHEGSWLLWGVFLAIVAALLARTADPDLRRRALTCGAGMAAGFFAFLLLVSNPFERLDPAPWEGIGLNPLLQHPALAAHPPILFLGYAMLAGAYALAIAGLWRGRLDRDWARAMRPWALAAWSFLTLGIGLGAWWAYYELGWGGWWAWDPVENASLAPWLLSTALIHSLRAGERRGALLSWSALLAILAFASALFGTFLVRSGAITSIHQFASDPARGVFLLALIAVIAGTGGVGYALRAPRLELRDDGFTPTSREGFLIINNLFLTVITLSVLFGTVYPMILEAFGGAMITVGPPYYNLAVAPVMALCMVFIPFGPLAAWGKGLVKAGGPLIPAAALALLAGALTGWLSPGWGLAGVIGAALAVWLTLGAAADLWRMHAVSALDATGVWRALAHAGLGVLALGATADLAGRRDQTVWLEPGGSALTQFGEITLEEVVGYEGSVFRASLARVTLGEDTFFPERRFFPARGQMTTEASARGDWGGDTYVTFGEPRRLGGDAAQAGSSGDESAEGASPVRYLFPVTVGRHPMIGAVWIGAGFLSLSGFALLGLSLWGRRR